MNNSAFLDTCRDSHEDMLDHHDLNQDGKDFAKILDLIENFPPFVVKMRIWIPSRIMLLAVLVVTMLESDFRWARNSQIRISSPNPIRKWVDLLRSTGQPTNRVRKMDLRRGAGHP